MSQSALPSGSGPRKAAQVTYRNLYCLRIRASAVSAIWYLGYNQATALLQLVALCRTAFSALQEHVRELPVPPQPNTSGRPAPPIRRDTITAESQGDRRPWPRRNPAQRVARPLQCRADAGRKGVNGRQNALASRKAITARKHSATDAPRRAHVALGQELAVNGATALPLRSAQY